MAKSEISKLLDLLESSVASDGTNVIIQNHQRLQENIHKLAEISALGSGAQQGYARYLIRLLAIAFGTFPASIDALYKARGRGELPHIFTVPAINLRMLTFDFAKAVFRVCKSDERRGLYFRDRPL